MRHRLVVGLLWLAFTVVGLVLAPSVAGRLHGGNHLNTAAFRANQQIARQYGGATANPGILILNLPSGQTMRSRGVQDELKTVDAAIAKTAPSLRVVSYAGTGSQVLVGAGGTSTIVLAYPPLPGGDIDTPEVDALTRIAKAAAPDLIGQLLLLARADERQLAAQRRRIDLRALLSEVAAEASAPEVDIAVDAPAALATTGNPDDMRRVFTNLTENAARYARARVVITATELDGHIRVEIDDDGPGIPEADRERVFDRFVRRDDSRERGSGSTGLGLAIAREITIAHGGEISIAQRIAAALRDDLVADRRVQRAVDPAQQQRARIAVVQVPNRHFGHPAEDLVAGPGARDTQDRDPFRVQTACDEREDLRGDFVQPLHIVDDADQRPLLSDLGEQRQGGEPEEKPVRWRPGAQSERGRERVALRDGQPLEVIEHRRAELMEAAEGELHLRLHSGSRCDAPAVDLGGRVREQRALADARVTAQDHDPTGAGEHVGQETIERLTFLGAAEESRHVSLFLSDHPRPVDFRGAACGSRSTAWRRSCAGATRPCVG
jgi:hypothetical protein